MHGDLHIQRTRTTAPRVSVITAAFNARPTIEACIRSVAVQDYPHLEHIVIDGGSTDGTVEVLRRYEDCLAFWKSEPDRGIYDAWNKGLKQAQGEWICFLGADDEFLPGAVSAYMELAAANPGAEYLASQVRWIHPSGYTRTIGEPWAWPRFARYMSTAHVGSMHSRQLFERLGAYDTSYRIVADYAFLLRARNTLKAAYMPTITAQMKAGGASDTLQSLDEQMRAKMEAGGRNPLVARLERHIARLKFSLRPLRESAAGRR